MGIFFICVGVIAISANDMMIKLLSGGYPLHQMIFARSAIGMLFTFGFVMYEGGPRILRTRHLGFHALRGVFVVMANMSFYAAVAVMPLGQATALFFVAPLLITVLAIPILGEPVGPLRLGAVVVGFTGVLVMQQPWKADVEVSRLTLLLPVIGAGFYALMQVMTRKLGVTTRASAMAVYTQGTFLLVSVAFFLIAGDGRFAEGVQNESLKFLLRAWIWPAPEDWIVLIGLGTTSGLIGYCLSAAYRTANAATVAPFEYIGLPLAILWGWVMFGEWPSLATWIGCALIIGAGLFVFVREQQKQRPLPGRRARWGRR
ncbi:S-adenosylmethionine uptake transporter [Tropicibacter naphthalenivorans]|uniref:Carboxylate/amino acid/amine transporter n=1 Tax=Tropicibacter naphthalenivorans TaxID=441103 RepID=A0A0P1GB78_9RHOB|nr:carboxylate/amino acid/amine transporter [Tropicibacter naphthalenivorans]SMC81331.1 S-adenosylmethionine uptake transporter [Tropicibacter naphthalenivorans]